MTRASELPAEELRAALLAWFDAHQRDLPWRHDRTPYRVWVSEVMLQQTQVATVVPYFARFLARFPTPEALARAPLAEVLSRWKGLGYYSRARSLHRAAQAIAQGGMPRTAAQLRELPGFGPYTAAAVASLAFGERVALVDGNVARVLSRLLALEDAPGSKGREARLWSAAEALLDPLRPGACNEAWMELGARVCTPSIPTCGECPLGPWCEARRLGLQETIPPPRVRPKKEKLELACAVVRRGEALLLGRRPEQGLFGGLWELPSATMHRGLSGPAALRVLGLEATGGRAFAIVRRTLTHRALTLRLYACQEARSRPLPGYLERRFVAREELPALAISTAMSKALARVVR